MLDFEKAHCSVIDEMKRDAPVARDAECIPTLKWLFEMLRVEPRIKRIGCKKRNQVSQFVLLRSRQRPRLFPESRAVHESDHAFEFFRMWARNFFGVVKRYVGFSVMAANVLSINSGRYSPSGSRSAIRPMTAERKSLTSCCNVNLLMKCSIQNRVFLSTSQAKTINRGRVHTC